MNRVEIEGIRGSVVLATDRAREAERVEGSLLLGPAEGAVIALDTR